MDLGGQGSPAAGVAELVDALDLGSSDESRGGSNPSARTSPVPYASAFEHNQDLPDMQITEVLSEGLHREFRILVAAKDLDAKLTTKLSEMQPNVHLKGFRPGKAPVSYLKKAHGKSLMGEIIKAAIDESSEQLIKDHELHPAVTPRIDFTHELDNVLAGKADLEFTMKVDLMPDFDLADLGEIKIERLIAEVTDADVETALQKLAESRRTYTPKLEAAAAEKGDTVTIDFLGKIDGVPFEGGKAENFDLVLGGGSFVPGFEDQLIGAKANEKRNLSVTFPEDYGGPDVAGKPAEFEVTVKAVKAPVNVAIDNEFAKRLGVNSLGDLRERVREQVKSDFARASRLHLKRRLLDALDAAHDFELPPVMLKMEFDAIWKQVEAELKREGKTAADEGTTEEGLKNDYREIAARRVRLGLVLSKIGDQNGLVVSEDELGRAISARARYFPGQEQKIFEYYTRSPNALAEIRAPLFEDKAIDFVIELAQVTDRMVDRETLFMDPDDAAEKLAAGEKKKGRNEKSKAKDEKAKPKKK